MAGRPIRLNDERPICTVENCTAPRTLGTRYTRADGTVVAHYRPYCSWHHTHPLTVPNPNMGPRTPASDAPMCEAAGCTRSARRYPPHYVETDPRRMTQAQKDYLFIYGRPSTEDHRYGRTCHRHALKDIPGWVNPLVADVIQDTPPRVKRRYTPPTAPRRLKLVPAPEPPKKKKKVRRPERVTNPYVIAQYEKMSPAERKKRGITRTPEGWMI